MMHYTPGVEMLSVRSNGWIWYRDIDIQNVTLRDWDGFVIFEHTLDMEAYRPFHIFFNLFQ